MSLFLKYMYQFLSSLCLILVIVSEIVKYVKMLAIEVSHCLWTSSGNHSTNRKTSDCLIIDLIEISMTCPIYINWKKRRWICQIYIELHLLTCQALFASPLSTLVQVFKEISANFCYRFIPITKNLSKLHNSFHCTI